MKYDEREIFNQIVKGDCALLIREMRRQTVEFRFYSVWRMAIFAAIKNLYPTYSSDQANVTSAVAYSVWMFLHKTAFGYPPNIVFEVIHDIENEIKTLDKIENKPRALATKIDSLHKAVAELVTIIDTHPVKETENGINSISYGQT